MSIEKLVMSEKAPRLVNGMVSLVVPCYNVDRFIAQFLESLICQTYKHLEIILVNDGSTDGTRGVISQHVGPLRAEGYAVHVVDQENRGLAGAINGGLGLFSGEFLMWPDPDDWLTPNSIERRVELFGDYPDVGLLRTNCEKFIESTQSFDGHMMPLGSGVRRVEGLFLDILRRRTFLAPVSSMVRSSCFLDVNPLREIYATRRASQNFQMLLPLVHAYPVLESNESLAYYRVREDSRSRSATTPTLLLERHKTIQEVTRETLRKLKSHDPRVGRLLDTHYDRNVCLPLLFQIGSHQEAKALIAKSNLSRWHKALAGVLLLLRRVPAGAESRYVRFLGRAFRRVVATKDVWQCLSS